VACRPGTRGDDPPHDQQVAEARQGVIADRGTTRGRTITIQKGQKVTWKRVKGRHTVTLKNGSFDKVLSRGHPSRALRFTKRGTFRYYCRFHRSLGMKG
jgi:plastocyanin